MKVLVVDDDSEARDSLSAVCELVGHEAVEAEDGPAAMVQFSEHDISCIFLDLEMPGMSGFEVLEQVLRVKPAVSVIIVSATDRAKETVKALRMGAFDYIAKPYGAQEIMRCLEAVAASAISWNSTAELNLVGVSNSIRKIEEILAQVAPTSATVLIQGETGTGKELIARAIHELGPNPSEPFLAFNCGAIAVTLFESELFGHEKGAFTGATGTKIGKLEFARKGTLFLDEVNSLSQESQQTLLRALEEKAFNRVGSSREIRFEARIVAAANENLAELVEQGKFRRDLYYRLNVVCVTAPPLRERPEDIRPIAEHFLRQFSRKHKKSIPFIEPDTLFVLTHYPWPGNVRELRNVVERAVIFTADGEPVGKRILPEPLLLRGDAAGDPDVEYAIRPLAEKMAELEKAYLETCLEHFNGNVARTAKALGVHRNTLFNKINAYGLRTVDRS